MTHRLATLPVKKYRAILINHAYDPPPKMILLHVKMEAVIIRLGSAKEIGR